MILKGSNYCLHNHSFVDAISYFFTFIFLLITAIRLFIFGIIWQTHLYTGLSYHCPRCHAWSGCLPNKKLNHAIGWLAAMLFSYNFYWRLFPNHHKHHQHVATEEDPDYHASNRFLPWYFSFILNYVNIWQILLMAVTYNLLKLIFPVSNLVLFWMLPAVLSTLQLFYFGTYLPHRGSHDNKHHSGTIGLQPYLGIFVLLFFFGYHYEHHEAPNTPWWRLWKTKNSL